jgi:hypothetical protein
MDVSAAIKVDGQFEYWPAVIASAIVSVEPLTFRQKIILVRALLDESTVRVAWLVSQARSLKSVAG